MRLVNLRSLLTHTLKAANRHTVVKTLCLNRRRRRAGKMTYELMISLKSQYRLMNALQNDDDFGLPWEEARVKDVYPETCFWKGRPFSPGWEVGIK